MKILIEFDCNNAAFTDDFHGEVASMLVQQTTRFVRRWRGGHVPVTLQSHQTAY